MKKRNTIFYITFLAPALICFGLLYLYPVLRTALMSLFDVPSIGDGMAKWTFAGFDNYKHLFSSTLFRQSMMNLLKIWTIGGMITMLMALLFAVILSSGIKGKKFWRSVIYLPNIISAVAIANMWLQYVYNTQYGMLKNVFSFLHIEALAKINWTSSNMIFISMLIAYCFGSIGYYMLIILAGIERIPSDLYESAELAGATPFQKFSLITFPLIRNVFRTCIMLWTVSSVNFFTWSRMFSKDTSPTTVTPVVYMYDAVFGLATGGISDRRVGTGTAVGVLMTLMVILVSTLLNRVFKEKELEY